MKVHPLTFVASAVLPEAAARAAAQRIGEDERFAGAAIDLNEAAEGRWQVSVYFDRRPDRRAQAALADAVQGGPGRSAFTIARLADTDWVRRSLAALAPVRAGRFLVHGSHDRDTLLPNDIAIEIEAGLAFGTGHHGTTVGCLTAIDRLAKRQQIQNALDVGTGSGVLAIAIAKRTKARVMASDIDPVAVQVAHDNVRLNGVGRPVTTVVADGLRSRTIGERAPYDLIAANILAGPLVALAPAMRRALAPGGTIILSGLLTSQARRVAAIYRGQGVMRACALVSGDWATLLMTRR